MSAQDREWFRQLEIVTLLDVRQRLREDPERRLELELVREQLEALLRRVLRPGTPPREPS